MVVRVSDETWLLSVMTSSHDGASVGSEDASGREEEAGRVDVAGSEEEEDSGRTEVAIYKDR